MPPFTPAQQQRLLEMLARAADRQEMRFDRTLSRAYLDEHDRLVDAYLTLADAIIDGGGR